MGVNDDEKFIHCVLMLSWGGWWWCKGRIAIPFIHFLMDLKLCISLVFTNNWLSQNFELCPVAHATTQIEFIAFTLNFSFREFLRNFEFLQQVEMKQFSFVWCLMNLAIIWTFYNQNWSTLFLLLSLSSQLFVHIKSEPEIISDNELWSKNNDNPMLGNSEIWFVTSRDKNYWHKLKIN